MVSDLVLAHRLHWQPIFVSESGEKCPFKQLGDRVTPGRIVISMHCQTGPSVTRVLCESGRDKT